jgi:hypothetical protein
MRPLTSVATSALLLTSLATSLHAQFPSAVRTTRPPMHFGGGLVIAQPLGQFANAIDIGFGGAATFSQSIDRRGIFSFRADAAYLVYGHESKQIPFNNTSGRIQLDLATYNNIFHFSAGPQLTAVSGPLRPYASAQVGLSYLFTESSIAGTDNGTDFANTENYHFAKISYLGALGILIPLDVRSAPVAIDLGAQYMYNGHARYLTPGDIHEDNTGGYTTTAHGSQANLIMYRLGVRVGVN